jgi:hypothetical protein
MKVDFGPTTKGRYVRPRGHDLAPKLLELLQPRVLPVGQRPHLIAASQQFIDSLPGQCPRGVAVFVDSCNLKGHELGIE